jgi:hypothetical protein
VTRPTVAVRPCAVALLLRATTALAADVPGDASTETTLAATGRPEAGTFQGPASADWYRVELRAGRTYAARIDTDACATVELRDAEGGRLAFSPRTSDKGVVGWTYTPTASGRYSVVARRCDPAGAPRTAPYSVWLIDDATACRGTAPEAAPRETCR